MVVNDNVFESILFIKFLIYNLLIILLKLNTEKYNIHIIKN